MAGQTKNEMSVTRFRNFLLYVIVVFPILCTSCKVSLLGHSGGSIAS